MVRGTRANPNSCNLTDVHSTHSKELCHEYTTQRSSEAAKQRSSEAAKQRSSEAAKQRSSEAAKQRSGEQNFPDNVIYEMDNLDVLRGMNSETVDLIATDPPFNKKRNRAGTAGQYEDAWRWTDHPTMQGKQPDQWLWQPVHREWLDEIKDANRALFDVIEATRKTQDDDTAAFLCFLSVRLLEMHRVLKPTGSIYLHCDHSANAYIRMCMDAIFLGKNSLNEIAWLRKSEKHNLASRRYPQTHDTIYYYAKDATKHTHNPPTTPYDDEYVKTHYKFRDNRGRYATFPCTNERGGNKSYEFRGITRAWRWERSRMEEMFKAGMLTQATPKSPFRYKKYISSADGVKVSDLWVDVTDFEAGERTGSPDQKPLKAYERMILGSSNNGDIVLDPFAGCATTIIAARKHKRRWVGIDRRQDARFHVVCRMAGIKQADADEIRKRPHLAHWLDEQLAKYEAQYRIEPPVRTDEGKPAVPRLEQVFSTTQPSVLSHREMHTILLERFGPYCWGCDFDGLEYGERGGRYLELDHVNPKSAGGHDHLDNRALLCGPCNKDKSDRTTLIQLRRQTMGTKNARQHRIDLREAGAWCRERLMQEIRSSPQQLGM
ncbi:MAG: DNA methyltransferase [Chloroflexi bacterium]|nr:DNA methyltransferase [Chloroflexota bacterium]